VTSAEFQLELRSRAELADLVIDPALLAPLETYYRLLVRWNAAVNLTALRLEPLTSEAIDRLLIEPIAAARSLAEVPKSTWFDLGSGGGSPALPLLLACPSFHLTMIEARERKAAFLREAVRTLGVTADVEIGRFEETARQRPGTAGLVTARGVRVDAAFGVAAAKLLCSHGILALFGSEIRRADVIDGFDGVSTVELLAGPGHVLRVLRRVPRGTSRG
jgi:16S rRNA (guanine527-N7)-methyltransferase